MHSLLTLLLLLPGGPAAPERELRTYDLRFLTEEVPQFPARPSSGTLDLVLRLNDWEEGAGVAFTVQEDVEEAPDAVGLSEESIIKLIRKNIAEDSWGNDRNSIYMWRGELAVVQSPEVHGEIAKFLARLRAERARIFEIEVAVLPVDALGEEALQALPSLPPGTFESAVRRAGKEARRISLTAYNEQTVSGLSGKRRATVTETEVNQTGVIPVANVVVRTLPIGVSLEARPVAVVGTRWVHLELHVTRLRVVGEVTTRKTLFADIESVPLQEESVHTVLLVEPGRPVVAGFFRDALAEGKTSGFAVVVELTPRDLAGDVPAPPPPSGTFPLRVYDAAFLLGPRAGRLPPDLFLRLLQTNVEPAAWKDQRASLSLEGTRLHVTARPATQKNVAAWLEDLARQHARLAVITVEVFEAPLESLLALRQTAGSGWLLPREWRQSDAGRVVEPVLEATAVGLVGERLVARGFQARTFVFDVEGISGGTGFSILEIPDLVARSAGDGFSLRATVKEFLGTKRLKLDLELRRCRIHFERRAEVLSGTTVAAREDLSQTTQVRLPNVIDLPSQEALICRTAMALPRGQPAMLKLERVGTDKGRVVVATVDIQDASEEGR